MQPKMETMLYRMMCQVAGWPEPTNHDIRVELVKAVP